MWKAFRRLSVLVTSQSFFNLFKNSSNFGNHSAVGLAASKGRLSIITEFLRVYLSCSLNLAPGLSVKLSSRSTNISSVCLSWSTRRSGTACTASLVAPSGMLFMSCFRSWVSIWLVIVIEEINMIQEWAKLKRNKKPNSFDVESTGKDLGLLIRATACHGVFFCFGLSWWVVGNVYTLTHFLADFPKICSIVRADEKFLEIIPCMLGLLPEYIIDVPQLQFKIERYLFYGLFTQTPPRLSCLLTVNYWHRGNKKQNNHIFNRQLGTIIRL